MGDLIIEWMFTGVIIVSTVCITALAICVTVALIRMIMEELKK